MNMAIKHSLVAVGIIAACTAILWVGFILMRVLVDNVITLNECLAKVLN